MVTVQSGIKSVKQESEGACSAGAGAGGRGRSSGRGLVCKCERGAARLHLPRKAARPQTGAMCIVSVITGLFGFLHSHLPHLRKQLTLGASYFNTELQTWTR